MSARVSLSSVSVTRGKRDVLHNISFDTAAGECVGLIGPNGAGKSTLLRTVAGLQHPSLGTCKVEGDEVTALRPRERARRLAYLPQARPVFWSVTARDVVALGRFAFGAPLSESAEDDDAVARALADADAAALADRPVSELSGGELARVHLARALAGETPLMLVDEPVTALDPAHQLAVMTLLRKKADSGRTVIAALHDLALAARYCTRVIVLKDGAIAADGAPNEMLTPALLRDVFDVEATIDWNETGAGIRLAPLGS